MTQKSRPGRCFLLSVPCHSRSRKRFTLPSSFVAGFVFLQHIGWGLGGRYHGWDLDALAERMGCGWTILWLGPGCSGRTDGIWVDDIMVGPGCSVQNGCGLGGRYHGWDLDALAERMGSGWTISWLGPGCSGRTDGVWVDDIMVGTWMLWQNGWGLGGRYHGWDLDALAERMRSGWTISWLGPGCSGRTDGVWVDDIMVGTWMLWQNGWGPMGSGWTISWLGPGCSGRTDGVWVDDIMVGTWMLWQNGWGLGGRYHGWDLDALAERMGFGWTIS